MKCEVCDGEFHYCTSCSPEVYYDQGCCSLDCMKRSDDYLAAIANCEALVAQLDEADINRLEVLQVDTDVYYPHLDVREIYRRIHEKDV